MNLKKFEIDNSEEIPISKKVVTKKEKKVIKLTSSGNFRTAQVLKSLPRKLKKRLYQVDRHHIDDVLHTIGEESLQSNKVSTKVANTPKLCQNCDHCILALNYCSIYLTNCSTLNNKKNIETCSFKILI